MFGGAGSDTFRFIDSDDDRDRISDFELGVDMIGLSLWGVTSLNDAGLVIEERTNGQGVQQGDLVITFNGNSNYIRIDHLDTADIAALDANHFICA
jgi:Ca2+-binding RTX toxin-like protein